MRALLDYSASTNELARPPKNGSSSRSRLLAKDNQPHRSAEFGHFTHRLDRRALSRKQSSQDQRQIKSRTATWTKRISDG